MTNATRHGISDLIADSRLIVGDGYRAKNSELSIAGIPFARAGNISGGFNFSDADLFPIEDVHKVGIKVSRPGDVVFTSKGTVGRFAYVTEDTPQFVYSPQLCFWRSTDESVIDSRYLFYWMQGPEFYTQYRSVASQTDMAEYVSLRDQRQMQITLPPIHTQRSIAHILGTLDDKIELNRQMNRTLDEIARTLFTSWFVNFDPVRAKAEARQPEGMDAETAALFPDRFVASELGPIPEGWEVKTLGDIAANVRDNVPVNVMNPDDNYVGLEHLPKRHIGLTEWSTAAEVTSNKSRFVEGDILFGKLRPYFHKVVVAPISGVCSTDILVIRPKECRYGSLALCAASSDQIIALADSHSSGTRMPRAKWTDLRAFQIAIPKNARPCLHIHSHSRMEAIVSRA